MKTALSFSHANVYEDVWPYDIVPVTTHPLREEGVKIDVVKVF